MAVMVVPCPPADERVQLLADCGESDVVEEEPRGSRSAAAPGTAGRTGRDRGQAEGAARRLTNMPRLGSRFGLERSREALNWDFAASSKRICALDFRLQTGPVPRRVYAIRATVASAPMQVRDLSVLSEAFGGASIAPQVARYALG